MDEEEVITISSSDSSDFFNDSSDSDLEVAKNSIPNILQSIKLEREDATKPRSPSSSPEIKYGPTSLESKGNFGPSTSQSTNDIKSAHCSQTTEEKLVFKFPKLKTTPDEKSNERKTEWASMKSPPIFNFESKSKIQTQKHIGSQSRKVQKYTNSNLARKRDLSENPAKSEIKNLASCSPAINSPSHGSQGNGEFEVEKIVDHEELTPERVMYKVKWKGFDDSQCTWEPLEHLTSCIRLVYDYKTRAMCKTSVEQRYQQLLKFLSQHTEQLLNGFVQRFCNDQGVMSIPKVNLEEMHDYIRNFARHPELMKTNKPELDYLREQLLTSILYDKRQEQLEDLKNYEIEINVTAGNAVAPIYVINNVDLEVVPKNFTHTSLNIPTQGVIVNEEPIIWCECKDNCRDSECCCGHMNDSTNAYDKNKRLIITHGTPIYECNKNCKCSDSCPNRVIQLGTQVKLAIYKTYNDCGWGVQTLENIPKGTYVTEYVGEILTYKAASLRCNQTYLFNLDFNGSTAYVIDAGNYGNISHFINHSCDPNLAVFPAYIQCLDPNLHRLPLFAIRDIQKGEQLSFSYYKSASKTSNKTGSKKIKCKCDSKSCCGYLLVE